MLKLVGPRHSFPEMSICSEMENKASFGCLWTRVQGTELQVSKRSLREEFVDPFCKELLELKKTLNVEVEQLR
ncbi:hypothetical protein MRB53_006062 [Persea americana]|uniref:Uncharacterized protein n=1 Tax=Persea americana TaxID=3435 RepID=A0ACC2MFB7_PERAE|nr:hypothetical protein MRB53_006062 [Persea americana]